LAENAQQKVKRMTTSATSTVSTQEKLAVWLLCVRMMRQ